MDEVRAGGVEPVEVETLEQRQLLEGDRPLRPEPGLQHPVAPVVEPDGRLDRGLPCSPCPGRSARPGWPGRTRPSRPGCGTSGRSPRRRSPDDQARRARGDPALAGAGGLGLGGDAVVGVGQRRVAEQGARHRHVAARQVHVGRGRPMVAEQRFHGADRRRRSARRWAGRGGRSGWRGPARRAPPRVPWRSSISIRASKVPGTQAASMPVPGMRSSPRDAAMRDRQPGRRRPLAADHLGALRPRGVQDQRRVAGGAVEVGLDHLQREGGRRSRRRRRCRPAPGSTCRPRWRSNAWSSRPRRSPGFRGGW